MPEPNEIVDFIEKHYSKNLPLAGKKVLISAGPTIEELDPVRFISNHSSGKMGYSLAETALSLGADVKLISDWGFRDDNPYSNWRKNQKAWILNYDYSKKQAYYEILRALYETQKN